MAEISPATALRQLQAAQAAMKKARKAMLLAREAPGDEALRHQALKAGWESLCRAHREMAAVPLPAATDPVMTRQLAVQRYASSLLVRLRRLARNDPAALDGIESDGIDAEGIDDEDLD